MKKKKSNLEAEGVLENSPTEYRLQSPHSKRQLTTSFGRIVERASYRDIFACVLMVLVSSAAYYSWLATTDHGLKTSAGDRVTALTDTIYFSIVTFTSLGYGDIAPIGWGRVVAGFLVLAGLFLVALIVGKIASERQYSMLLLLHTSDRERRMRAFAADLRQVVSAIESGCDEEDRDDLRRTTKTLAELLEAINNYVVFHANQAKLVDFGNDAALLGLCREMSNAQRACVMAFKSIAADDVVCRRSYAVADRLTSSVNLISAFRRKKQTSDFASELCLWAASPFTKTSSPDPLESKPEQQTLKTMLAEMEALRLWANTNIHASLIAQVFEQLPRSEPSNWPEHEHKRIAALLGISNRLAQKCIDHLLERREIKGPSAA